MKKIILFMTILVICFSARASNASDKWEPFNFLIGKWEGEGSGKFGNSTIFREYTYLMGNTYIFGKERSVYEKQEKNPKGEIHENWNIISYDKGRSKYVLRQFHNEDIVNIYVMDSAIAVTGKYIFETEAMENFDEGWKAREIYEIVNENEFIEHFFLAAPGEEFQEHVKSTFRRVK